jgi:hypothetical protein
MPVPIEMPILESDVLRENPLGDPANRRLPVILLPDYAESTRHYSVLIALAGCH